MLRLPRGFRVGGAFKKFTVTWKVALALLPAPSVTVKVMAAVPDWLVVGIRLTVRFDPLPPRTIRETGIRAGLDEARLTTRFAAGVSASPTVKESKPLAAFCANV